MFGIVDLFFCCYDFFVFFCGKVQDKVRELEGVSDTSCYFLRHILVRYFHRDVSVLNTSELDLHYSLIDDISLIKHHTHSPKSEGTVTRTKS